MRTQQGASGTADQGGKASVPGRARKEPRSGRGVSGVGEKVPRED